MKKLFALFMVLVLCVVLASCGSDEPANSEATQDPAQNTTQTADVGGEVFNAGNVSALAPNGWKAFPVSDVFAEEEGATDPDVIQICKGAETEFDILSNPYLQINYYDSESIMMEPSKEWYENTQDLEPITAGDYTWTGFTGTSFEYPMAILWSKDASGNQYQVSIWLEMEGESISVNDADVQAILASIQPVA